ncbi:Phosphatidylcholine-sterol acyltransferase [Halotydeus destructor]|nr:Phosphatidylcholine-sterol acyltransferase [Halotydeus destructor]
MLDQISCMCSNSCSSSISETINVLRFASSNRHPVILVPGYQGSQLEVKLNGKSDRWSQCFLHRDRPELLWFQKSNYSPRWTHCWLNLVTLKYDRETKVTQSALGVDIQPRNFGSTGSCEFTSPNAFASHTNYFNSLVKFLVRRDYQRDVNIRGATYDWRRAPHENTEFMNNMKALIEDTQHRNGNTKVAILRSFANDTLIQSNGNNFTVDDYEKLFTLLGHADAYEMWTKTSDLLDTLSLLWPGKQGPISAIIGPPADSNAAPKEPKNPVILVPGYMGSQLELQLARLDSSNPACVKSTDHGKDYLWFHIHNYRPVQEDCWLENARMHYNSETRRAYSDKGVFVKPREFGNTTGIEFVSPQATPSSPRVRRLYSKSRPSRSPLRLAKGNTFGPISVDENEDFTRDFKNLIEETVAQTRKPAIVICHSMGGLFTYAFLRDQSDQWKKDNIQGWIVVASPLGGNFKYMYGYFADDDYPATINRKIRVAERTFSSTTFLMPYTKSFDGVALVETPTRNYTVNDYKDFFAALDYPDAYEQRLDVENVLGDSFRSPGEFPVYCVGGVGFNSLVRAVFDSELSRSAKFTAVYDDGDGFVDSNSMRQCKHFADGSTRFTYKEFNLDHMEIIQKSQSVNYIVSAVQDLNGSQ